MTNIHLNLAPSPQRGLAKAVFTTVEAIGGNANMKQVLDLLPAAIEDSTSIGKKRVYDALHYCKNAGYLVHEPKSDTWRIAPMSYYEARQKWRLDPTRDKRTRRQGARAINPSTPEPLTIREVDWLFTTTLAVITFLAGAVLGFLAATGG